MMRRVAPVVAIVLAVYLDSIFFRQVHLWGTNPDALLAVIVTLGVLAGPKTACIAGVACGLAVDVLFGKHVGLNALTLMLSGLAGGSFYLKFYADNVIVPTATAAACAFVKEHLYALVLVASGGKLDYARLLPRYILPSTLLTGVLCVLAYICLKPALQRQVKSRHVI